MFMTFIRRRFGKVDLLAWNWLETDWCKLNNGQNVSAPVPKINEIVLVIVRLIGRFTTAVVEGKRTG
jgi:hypothetical protein